MSTAISNMYALNRLEKNAPPVIDGNNNIYICGNKSGYMVVQKSTNGGTDFSEIATYALTNNGYISFRQGIKCIHICYVNMDGSGNILDLRYSKFNTSDADSNADSFVTTHELITSTILTDFIIGTTSCEINSRSDGDVIVFYSDAPDSVMGADFGRVNYARREGSSWTTGIAVDSGGEIHFYPRDVVLGSSDKIYLLFDAHTSASALPPTQIRSLSSANGLGTMQVLDNVTTNYCYNGAVYYDNGGTDRIVYVRICQTVNPGANYTISYDNDTTINSAVDLWGSGKRGSTGGGSIAVDASNKKIFVIYLDYDTNVVNWIYSTNDGSFQSGGTLANESSFYPHGAVYKSPYLYYWYDQGTSTALIFDKISVDVFPSVSYTPSALTLKIKSKYIIPGNIEFASEVTGWKYQSHYYMYEHDSNETLYIPVISDTDNKQLKVFKSTDGTSWSEDGSYSDANNFQTCKGKLIGDHLHIIATRVDDYCKIFYTHHIWDVINRTWDLHESIVNVADAGTYSTDSQYYCFDFRSDGDIVFVYRGEGDDVYPNGQACLQWGRKENTTWTTGLAFASNPNYHFYEAEIMVDLNDVAHTCYVDEANNLYYNTIDASNNLGTPVINYDLDSTSLHSPGKAVIGGVERIIFPINDVDTSFYYKIYGLVINDGVKEDNLEVIYNTQWKNPGNASCVPINNEFHFFMDSYETYISAQVSGTGLGNTYTNPKTLVYKGENIYGINFVPSKNSDYVYTMGVLNDGTAKFAKPKKIKRIEPVAGSLKVASITATIFISTDIGSPMEDTILGNWKNSDNTTINLCSYINEDTADDNDFIKSGDAPSTYKVKLSPITNLGNTNFKYNVSYRYEKETGDDIKNLKVRLKDGTTTIVEYTHTDISDSYVEQEQELTTDEYNLITNFNDLYLEFEDY